MKRTAKFVLSLGLVLSMLLSLMVVAFASDPSVYEGYKKSKLTLKNVNELSEYMYLGKNGGSKGPIMIAPAKYTNNLGNTHNVYLVVLSDTEITDEDGNLMLLDQTTDPLTDIMVGFNMDNDYFDNAKKVILKKIPKGSKIIFAGHSLGGMVEQQLAADKQIQKRYQILYTIVTGTPAILPGEQEGDVVRLGDTHDIVNYASYVLFTDPDTQFNDLKQEDGGYRYDILFKAHRYSYRSNKVWKKYDVRGKKNGKAKLVVNMKKLKYYKSTYNGIAILGEIPQESVN